MFYTNIKPLELLRLPFTALFICHKGCYLSLQSNHLYCAQCVGCKEQKHSESTLSVHNWPIKVILKSNYPLLQSVMITVHIISSSWLFHYANTDAKGEHCSTTNYYGTVSSLGHEDTGGLRHKWEWLSFHWPRWSYRTWTRLGKFQAVLYAVE